MIKKGAKQIGFLIALLLAPVLMFSGTAMGQKVAAALSSSDSEIFPFATGEDPTAPAAKPAIPSQPAEMYTEQLYDVTDQGIKDPNGVPLQAVPGGLLADPASSPTSPQTPGLPGSTDAQNTLDEYQASIISNWGGKRAYTQKRLDDLNQNLQDEQANFNKLNKKVLHFQKALEPVQEQKDTLDSEIDLLNSQMNQSKVEIQSTEFQIADAQLTLKGLISDLSKTQAELDIQRKTVLDYILLVYREDERFKDFFGNGSTTFKLLLADSSVSDSLLGQDYANILEKTGREVFYSLRDKKLALDEKQKEIQDKQAEMEGLNQSLNQDRLIMEQNRQTKQDLLAQTEGEEAQYQQVLEQSIQQQLDSAIQIQNMKDDISYIADKLKVLDDSLAQAQIPTATPPQIPTTPSPDQAAAPATVARPETTPTVPARLHFFSWPVPPDRGIAAYFHDPTYPKKWGIHEAIDIRAKQFTEIHAPANAYVFQTKDNGMGYSYIILAHKDKFVTVYGHVTQILVKAGDVVKEGDVIGLSGATPGTKGAGWQTTGPHLHFEVWHDGVQVDPLDYLPVEQLPLEFIPEKYLKDLAPIAAQPVAVQPTEAGK
jgi:murein DD-endopeptidase MepM/ murein hydrolase activator NlpD